MKTLVYNPSKNRCMDCPSLMCRVYYPKTGIMKGYCAHICATVTGRDLCHLPRQPTTTKELELSFDFD